MTSLDRTVRDDLAALAADSRRALRTADDALRAARDRTRREAAAVPPDRQLALLHTAGVFGARVARAAAGGVAVLCTIVLLVMLHDPRADRTPGVPDPWWAWLLDRNAASIAAIVAALAVATHVVAGSIARRWLVSRWRAALGHAGAAGAAGELGRPLGGALDAWSVALAVAGPTCATVLLGVLAWTIGRARGTLTWFDGPEAGSLLADRLRDLTVAVPGVIAAALALGAGCARRARWLGVLEHRGVALLGGALALGAVDAALAHHLGPFTWDGRFAAASSLRTALTAIGGLGAFLIAASVALRRRRRELRAGGPAEAIAADDLDLLAIAGAFRSRLARIAAGAVAATSAIGLTVALHDPRGALRNHGRFWPERARWRSWLFDDQITIVVVVAVVVLAAGVAGAALADRRFASRLRQRRDDTRLALARQWVRRLDGWSVGLGVAGLAALGALIGIVGLTFGGDYTAFLTRHGTRVDGLVRHTRREVVAAIAVSLGTGLALGQACACARSCRARWLAALAHRSAIATGVAIGAIATIVWAGLDFGVSDISAAAADQPSAALQSALTAALTAALLLVTAGLALRRRRRECEAIEPASAAR